MATRLWQLQRSMSSRGFNDRTIFIASVILNLLLWIFVLITFPKDSPTAILHYTAGVGVDFIGEGWQIITLPSIGTLLLVVNTILARLVEKTGRAAFWVLWGTTPFIQCMLLATYAILLTLNT